ncbi:MAG: sigma-54-dependent Fis family transcriptional regulator [Polyangiaceae bacterium]
MARPPLVFEDTTSPIDRRSAAPPIAAILRATTSTGVAKTYRLSEGSCIVGSSATAGLVLEEPTVSRHHCEIALVPEGISVTDRGSLNGTFYLGQRIQRAILSLGATIQVGGATVVLDADTSALARAAPYDSPRFAELTGQSVVMRRIFGMLGRLAGSLVPVLIEGESGVGKEVVARSIHETSRLSGKPLVTVNCGALARDLVASELFGHVRGAFTGAVDARRGAFESADGGTLFLDEIGELPLDVQPALLRALESGETRRVGSDEVKRVKVRVLCATNKNLDDEVRAGRFREDLFFRVAIVRLAIPPLQSGAGTSSCSARKFAAEHGDRRARPGGHRAAEVATAARQRARAEELRARVRRARRPADREAGPEARSSKPRSRIWSTRHARTPSKRTRSPSTSRASICGRSCTMPKGTRRPRRASRTSTGRTSASCSRSTA